MLTEERITSEITNILRFSVNVISHSLTEAAEKDVDSNKISAFGCKVLTCVRFCFMSVSGCDLHHSSDAVISPVLIII